MHNAYAVPSLFHNMLKKLNHISKISNKIIIILVGLSGLYKLNYV